MRKPRHVGFCDVICSLLCCGLVIRHSSRGLDGAGWMSMSHVAARDGLGGPAFAMRGPSEVVTAEDGSLPDPKNACDHALLYQSGDISRQLHPVCILPWPCRRVLTSPSGGGGRHCNPNSTVCLKVATIS